MAKLNIIKKSVFCLSLLFAASFCCCAFAQNKAAPKATASLQAPSKAVSDESAKKEHAVKYEFFFRFLTYGICDAKNFEKFSNGLDSGKMQFFWKKFVEKKLGRTDSESGQIDVKDLGLTEKSWLIKFPTPQDMPMPSYAIICFDGKKARYFTLEKTLAGMGAKCQNPALICECTLDENGKFLHLNYGVAIDQNNSKLFIKAVMDILKGKLKNTASMKAK